MRSYALTDRKKYYSKLKPDTNMVFFSVSQFSIYYYYYYVCERGDGPSRRLAVTSRAALHVETIIVIYTSHNNNNVRGAFGDFNRPHVTFIYFL